MLPHPRGRHLASKLLLVGAATFTLACAPASDDGHDDSAHSHGGHSHEADDSSHGADVGPPPLSVFAEGLGVFIELSLLVAGSAAHFDVHLTDLTNGRAVDEGSLTVELTGASRIPSVLTAPGPERPGLFVAEGTLPAAEQVTARLIHRTDGGSTVVALGTLAVLADRAEAEAAAEAAADDEPFGAVSLPLEQQWSIGLRSAVLERRTLDQRRQVPGAVEVRQGSEAAVAAPFDGLLSGPDEGTLPTLGDRVRAGQVLGYLEPPLSIGDRAALSANAATYRGLQLDLDARELELEGQRLDLDRARAAATTSLEFARSAVARSEELRAAQLGTVTELQAAREAVALATVELEAVEARSASIERARAALEDLRAQVASAAAVASVDAAGRVPLVAPIGGEVVAVNRALGESVESQQALFRIVDLERVWLTAHVSEFDLAELGPAPGALLQLAGDPPLRFDVTEDLGGGLVHVGRTVDPQSRTVPLRFEARNPDGILRAGMFVDLLLTTGRAVDAVALPESAIAREAGRPVAFAVLDGETFQRRFLDLGVRDGGLVEVRSGLAAGERVVVDGAQVVRLASAAPTEFGHGHAH